ncbi:ABC transporter permease [Belnapia mucosa]|nr:ABC transporter permease [Belnapia mucosa]
MRRHRRISFGRILLGLVAGLVFAFLMLPLLVVFPISLSSASYLQFPPPGLSWQWYLRYLDDPSWIEATLRSVKVAALCTVLAMGLGVPLAFFLVRSRLPGIRLLDRLTAAPIIVPTIVLSIALYGVFARLQLIGEWYGIAVAHSVLALPFVVILVGAGLRTFDEAQEQAAAGLGARWPAILWRVTLPQLRPSLVSAAFLAFISSFDELVIAMFLSGAEMTLPKKMFDNIMMEIDPTIAAVSVLQILLVGLCLGLASLFGRGVLTTTMTR